MDAAIEASTEETTRKSEDTPGAGDDGENEQSTDNKFQKAIAAWRSMSLPITIYST
jgi:hypothetical protein